MSVATSSGCTARHVASKSKSAEPRAMRSSTEIVPSGEPSMHTMVSIPASLALIWSTYCSSQNTSLVPAFAKTWVSCLAANALYTENDVAPTCCAPTSSG